MGPPRERGGRVIEHYGKLRSHAASMGPPRERGGRLGAPHSWAAWQTRLQWGRRVNAAEGVRHDATGTRLDRLQWGRRVNAAEGRPRPRMPSEYSCFNGAAA